MVVAASMADSVAMTTQTAQPVPEPPTSRRLTRSSSDRVIAGVAGGLGRYAGIDPVVIRVILIVLIFFGGAGVIGYLAAWVLVPTDNSPHAADGRGVARRAAIVTGVLALTVVAAVGGAWGVAIGGDTAVALVVIGSGLVLAAAAFTRGGRWLILPAIVLALSAGSVAAADIDASGGVGERIYHPTQLSSVRDEYRLGVGHLYLDLRDVEFPPGEHRVRLEVGVGEIEVLVPDDVCVSTSAHVSMGATDVYERQNGGIDHDWEDEQPAAAGKPHLTIEGDVGVGEFRVQPLIGGRMPPAPVCGR